MGFLGELGNESLDRIRENMNDRLDEKFVEGYNEAAAACMEVVERKIEKLHAQIIDECMLFENEQFLLAQLCILKKRMDGELQCSIR